jgi:hypothetical protein
MTDLEELRARRKESLAETLNERKKARESKRFEKPKRRRMSITLSPDSYAWLCNKVSDGDFYNLSDGIERCIRETRRHQTKKDE